MRGKLQTGLVTVGPFECAWSKELKFKAAGRGCVSFEAVALNDVTVVFRDQPASQYYHYKTDKGRNYTIIIGSNRNRRFKIEVDGKTEVDVLGVGLCCSSAFQNYWISICDGLICVGRDRYPHKNCVFQWLDSSPNLSVQYVGLSSWDRHVSYRNVSVFPLRPSNCFWKSIDCKKYSNGEMEENEEGDEDGREGYGGRGLENFLECWDLSDMYFLLGDQRRAVPAHMIILAASGNFHIHLSEGNIIKLPYVSYQHLHALLQYIYVARTLIDESQLVPLRNLSLFFEVLPLSKQCNETIEHLKMTKKLLDSSKTVELAYTSSKARHCTKFPHDFPLDPQKLSRMLSEGIYSDVNLCLDGPLLVKQSHKFILSIWSAPFMKMFTNGMSESNSSEVCIREVCSDAFLAMLQFMYTGELNLEDRDQTGSLLLAILLLADQFGVMCLCQECCMRLSDYVSEGWCSLTG